MPLVDSSSHASQTNFRPRLEQRLGQESLVNRILRLIHQSFSEEEILQTVIREVVTRLDIQGCSADQYHPTHQSIRTHTQYSTHSDRNIRPSGYYEQFSAIYRSSLADQVIQFCPILPSALHRAGHVILACPLIWQQQVLGTLWLYKSQQEVFKNWEVKLIEQIAQQTAIALYKARCYQTTQEQIENLQGLLEKQEDFIQILAHEVRTPITNMLMALRMLETSLDGVKSRHQQFPDSGHPTHFDLPPPYGQTFNYLNILKQECQREIILINDLLGLQEQHLEHSPIALTEIEIKSWLNQLVEPFLTRIEQQQQSFQLQIAEHLPSIVTNPDYLSRAIRELLNNACKYTPAGQHIVVSAQVSDLVTSQTKQSGATPALNRLLEIKVSNTGNLIPEAALPRLFEKFYRVPGGDPAQQGGTGLGLALVKKLVTTLGGTIWVKSQPDETYFKVELPF